VQLLLIQYFVLRKVRTPKKEFHLSVILEDLGKVPAILMMMRNLPYADRRCRIQSSQLNTCGHSLAPSSGFDRAEPPYCGAVQAD